MDNASFELLSVTASIAPSSASWPKPDWSKTHLGDGKGVKPHVESGNPHWSSLHACVDHARECTLKLLGSVAGIDSDKSLSPHGRAEKKKEIGTKALSKLESSEHLAMAQRAVGEQCARWEKEIGLVPQKPDSATAMLHCEVRSFLSSMKSPAERLNFVNSNLGLGDPDVLADAVLGAPAFLSGLTPAEMAVVRPRVELTRNPEIAQAKSETLKALADTERRWRNAANQIRQAAGLDKPLDGAAN